MTEKTSLIVLPDARETRMFGRSGFIRLCVSCDHWSRDEAQKKMAKERFMDALVEDAKWQREHLGARKEDMGLCGVSGGTTLCPPHAAGCSAYTPKRSKL